MPRFRQRVRKTGEAGTDEAGVEAPAAPDAADGPVATDPMVAVEPTPDAAGGLGEEATIVAGAERTIVAGAEPPPLDGEDAPALPPPVEADDAVPADSVSALRRQRVELVERYADASADLGGLVIEMARRRDFRVSLLEQRAAAAAALEDEIASIDGRIVALRDRRRSGARERRLTAERVCGQCGGVMAADANFCAYCGAARPVDA
jgi:hypothetical protein